jgi:hypothetical protein
MVRSQLSTGGDLMRRVVRDNGLSITMFALFLVFLVAQSIAGYKANISENEQHRRPPESYGEYLTSGAFVEATFENWESEFLQMGAYVMLTALLIQKGSPESKKPDGDEVDADPRDRREAEDAPGPVKRGGLALTLYEHSLSIALLALFLLSFVLHALAATPSSTSSSWSTAPARCRCGALSPARSSGSSPCRTGRASSWPWPPSPS